MDGSLRKTNLLAALSLGIARIPILPVRVCLNARSNCWNKQPYISGWQEKATVDPDEINEFWDTYPDALPGIALGKAGLVVLDADRHGGPDGVQAMHELTAQ